MAPESVETLVRWCQQTIPDNHQAFEQLVARFQNHVYTTAFRLMGNQHDAEDQAQEVFVKVYTGLRKLEDPGAFPAWLTRITVNTCLDQLRRQQRLRVESLATLTDEVEWEVANTDPRVLSPEALALARELRACLGEALATMNDQERVILALREFDALSYEDMSTSLRIGLSATKMRVHRARLRFKQLVEERCPDVWQPTSAADDGDAAR